MKQLTKEEFIAQEQQQRDWEKDWNKRFHDALISNGMIDVEEEEQDSPHKGKTVVFN
jgi:hypothetical protein